MQVEHNQSACTLDLFWAKNAMFLEISRIIAYELRAWSVYINNFSKILTEQSP